MNAITQYEPTVTAIESVSSFERIAGLALDGASDNTKRSYRRALFSGNDEKLMGFLQWAQFEGITRASVKGYLDYLKSNGVTDTSLNQRLSAIKKFAHEAYENGMIADAQYASIKSIKNIKIQGKKQGRWLTRAQVQQMLDAPDVSTLKGLRDRAILAVALGAGLRREELVSLTVEHLEQIEGRWVLMNLVGKGNKTRTVPIAGWIYAAIERWLHATGINNGYIFLAFRKGDNLQEEAMSAQAIWDIVKEYSPVPNLAPHDLRRTFGKLSYKAGAPLTQIQKSLGHSSVQTTEKYISDDQDFSNAPSDYLRFSIA